MDVILNKCKKCGETKCSETWTAYGEAVFGYCANCESLIVVKSSPEYEKYLADSVAAKRPPTITCPYCQSTNTSKISTTSRMLSAGLFGLGSKKIGKQWHCNKCGSDF